MKMSLSLSEAEDLDASRHLKLAIRSGSQEGAPKTRPVFAPVVALSLSNAPPVRQGNSLSELNGSKYLTGESRLPSRTLYF